MRAVYALQHIGFSNKLEVPCSEGTDGFSSSRSTLMCPFDEAPLHFARFGCTSVHEPPPRGETYRTRRSVPRRTLICNSVRCVERPTLPNHRFWKGSYLKTSNEIASEGVAEAFSFEVLEFEPFQNLYSGRVGVSKLRTNLLFWWSRKRFRSKL